MRFVQWHGDDLPEAGVLVEGLPGVGAVGQTVADHLVAALEARPVARIHSPDLPPQSVVGDDGLARLVSLQLWHVPADGEAPALLVLTGDCQPLSSHGQYEVTSEILQRVEAAGCSTVYTLGGVPGPGTVLGAAGDEDTRTRITDAGADCTPPGPEGGIVGASGVFLGLAATRGMRAACLMGASRKEPVDVKAAGAVLDVLERLLGRQVPREGLEATAKSIEGRLDAEAPRYSPSPADVDHHYIG